MLLEVKVMFESKIMLKRSFHSTKPISLKTNVFLNIKCHVKRGLPKSVKYYLNELRSRKNNGLFFYVDKEENPVIILFVFKPQTSNTFISNFIFNFKIKVNSKFMQPRFSGGFLTTLI